jgi:hypothetical protein
LDSVHQDCKDRFSLRYSISKSGFRDKLLLLQPVR